MDERRWLCLDCGKNTLHGNDYYMLRNNLWRQLVPREQRHGMLCLSCVSERLGRTLQPEDFQEQNHAIDESDPVEQPMTLEDYGIIDTLTPAMLADIDRGLIDEVSSTRARKVARMIGEYMGSSSIAVPGLPDHFYLLRIEHMVDSGVLVVSKEAEDLIQCEVRLA
jgi:hypothetical protein